MSNRLDKDTFGGIIEKVLQDNEIEMLVTMPAGTLEATVQDNIGAGSVIQFFILLNSMAAIGKTMRGEMGLESDSDEWREVVDFSLNMVRENLVGGDVNEAD